VGDIARGSVSSMFASSGQWLRVGIDVSRLPGMAQASSGCCGAAGLWSGAGSRGVAVAGAIAAGIV
jgi:hypothetical protein